MASESEIAEYLVYTNPIHFTTMICPTVCLSDINGHPTIWIQESVKQKVQQRQGMIVIMIEIILTTLSLDHHVCSILPFHSWKSIFPDLLLSSAISCDLFSTTITFDHILPILLSLYLPFASLF